MKKSKENEMAQHSVWTDRSTHIQMNLKKLEDEKRKLENEVEILTSEKEYLQKSAEKVNTLQSRLEALKEMESRYQELKQEVSIDLLSLFLQHEELQSQFSARQIFVQDEISREELKRLREDNGALRGKLEAVEIACLLNDRPRSSRRISRSSCSSCAAKTRSYENVRFAASSSHPQSSRASCEAWK